jgi:pimeloyl-ACP methyl ester carboxylesterase
MQPLFEAFVERPVYAIDWPGFGDSERSERAYSPELFTNALIEFVRRVVPPRQRPVDVVAHSLSCEFAARAALHEPRLFRSLALLSPTGLGRGSQAPWKPVVDWVKQSPSLARWVHWALTTKPALRYSLNRSFHGKLDADLVNHGHASARKPNAYLAPLAFAAGELFTENAYDVLYHPLRVPTFVLFDRDPHSTFELVPQLTRENPFIRALRIEPSSGFPQLELPTAVELRLKDFYRAIELTSQVDDWEARVDTMPLSFEGDFEAA